MDDAASDLVSDMIVASSVMILKTGDKLPELKYVAGDFHDWIIAGMGLRPAQCQVVSVHRGQSLPPLHGIGAIVITGSAAMVTDHSDWIERSADWLREAVALDIPVLGICFGHQLLAYALGGDVSDNPNGIEVGTVAVRLQSAAQDDNLFRELPQTLQLHASHAQSVLTLPPTACLLASSERDPHHAFRVGDRAWGLQFHPEFTAEITRNYVAYYRRREAGKKRSGTLLSTETSHDTRFGDVVLRRFAQVVAERGRVDCPLDAR